MIPHQFVQFGKTLFKIQPLKTLKPLECQQPLKMLIKWISQGFKKEYFLIFCVDPPFKLTGIARREKKRERKKERKREREEN